MKVVEVIIGACQIASLFNSKLGCFVQQSFYVTFAKQPSFFRAEVVVVNWSALLPYTLIIRV